MVLFNQNKIMLINQKNSDDVVMWNEFRKGNHAAFTQIYQNYVSFLYNYSTSITPDRELIKDCLHDLFVELWKNHQNLGETTSVRFYLMASIKRKLVRHIETNQRHTQHHEAYYLENPDYIGSHEHRLVAFEEEKSLADNLSTSFRYLTKRQREAVSLKYFQDMDTDEISNAMNINPQSVYNLIFGALKILKEHISPEKLAFS
jgi:RNA polymerase sigma factor (sigma-70 family)